MLHVSTDSSVGTSASTPRFATPGACHDLARASIAASDVDTTEFLKREVLRVGASPAEISSAFAMAAEVKVHDRHVYDALTPRVRRLVDLAFVAGSSLSAADFG